MRLAVSKHLKFWPQETWKLWIVQRSASSNKPNIGSLWVWFKEMATCHYWWQWPWKSVQSEITAGRVLLLCPVWWRRGEENRIRWRSLWERPAARCLSWRDIWCSLKWDGMWEGWRWQKGRCRKRADAMYLGENAVDLWGTRSTAHSWHGPYCLILPVLQIEH